jgi:hypothetical protein
LEADSLLVEASANVTKQAGSSDVLVERQLTEAEIRNYINRMLDQSMSPKEIDAKLKKLADLNLFDHSVSSSYLRDEAERGHGIAYISPNAFMENCRDSKDRLEAKIGKVRAKSVRQIKACATCQHFDKTAAGKRCKVYSLPIVASGSELFPIIHQLVGNQKTASAKKAALVSIANRENEHGPIHVQANEATNAPFSRSQSKFQVRSSSDRKPVEPKTAFTVADVRKLHQAGESMSSIYKKAIKQASVDQVNQAIKKFVASLKGSKLKVALSQIDCTLLGGKLSSANPIIGAAKCGSCTYRTGMHCGFTGGTLLQFPGQEKAATNHRVAEGALKDGLGMVKDFDLMGTAELADIDIKAPEYVDVELDSLSKIDL